MSLDSLKENHSRDYDREAFGALWFAYRPYLVPIVIICLLGFVGRFALLSNANLIGLWADSLCRPELTTCPPLPERFSGWQNADFMVALIKLVAFGFFATLIFRILFSWISASAVSTIYDETSLRTSRFPMAFFDQNPVGRVVTRFSSDYGNVFRLFGGPLAEFLSIIFELISMIILAAYASPFFLVAILVFLAIHLGIYLLNRTKMKETRRELSASRSPSVAHFAETAQGTSIIRTFHREASFSARFNNLDKLYLSRRWRNVKVLMRFFLQNNGVTALMLLATGTMSWWLLQKGLVTIGSIGVIFGFITLSGTTVLMFFDWLAQVEEAIVGVERMNRFLRHEIEPGSLLPSNTKFRTNHPIETAPPQFAPLPEKAGVSIAQVSFRYHPEGPLILDNLSLDIAPGEKVGIIGRTGSGKSTLTQILLHLYPLESGTVRVNGQTAEDLGLRRYRQFFALISQEPILFRGLLRENLDLLGLAPKTQLLAALNRVGLDHWANEAGLNMMIEERGRNISVGEKQLLCMARTLVLNSPIIIMDEATSAIDPQSEEILVKATSEFFKEKTQILIAHRLSTLADCDRVVWLDHGRIREIDGPKTVLTHFSEFNEQSETSSRP